MPRLRSHTTTPTGGWRYLQPETQIWIESDHFDGLVNKVIEHRKYKGIKPNDFNLTAKDIEDQLCMLLGEQWCYAERGETWEPYNDLTEKIGVQQIVDFSQFAIQFISKGEPLVSKEESERRSNICKSCPFNKRSKTCICTPLYKMMEALIPTSRKIDGLHVCGLCGCSLQLKVLMPQAVIEADNANKKLKFTPSCWQNHG